MKTTPQNKRPTRDSHALQVLGWIFLKIIFPRISASLRGACVGTKRHLLLLYPQTFISRTAQRQIAKMKPWPPPTSPPWSHTAALIARRTALWGKSSFRGGKQHVFSPVVVPSCRVHAEPHVVDRSSKEDYCCSLSPPLNTCWRKMFP